VYLSEHPELILLASQAWGQLGTNVAAHAPDQAGEPLRIGQHTYSRGLGHHASGSISVLLDGQFAAFDAEIGLQPCSSGGTVAFRVFVDEEHRFDSGVLRATNAPCPVHVDLAGAEELRLETDDAGDGITCDMASWANARLTPATAAASTEAELRVNIAPFGRVVTWDPNRLDGARASRIEEFHAEDLFLDTDLPASADGTYRVPVFPNGLGCIGLQWLNRRAIKELALEFSAPSQVPDTGSVQVQGWFGESAWQGSWKLLAGEVQASGHRLIFQLSRKAGLAQTRKVRWVFPTAKPVAVSGLSAYSRSRWHPVNLLIESEKSGRAAHGTLYLHNGDLLASSSGRRKEALTEPASSQPPLPNTLDLNLSRPLHLSLRASRPSAFKSDPTILQFRLPTGSFGVAVEDALAGDGVYLPDHGLFVTRDPAPMMLADYKRKIAGRKTIFQQVRELPDQTLAQAIARTHQDAQREGPVMLSLACDNTKFVLERNGVLRFQTTTNLAKDWFATAGAMQPRFGTVQPTRLTRRLDGGWLPIPVITLEHDGLLYSECVFVAPCDEPGANPARLNRRSVCAAEFTITNTLAEPSNASLSLNFLTDSRHQRSATLTRCPGGYTVADDSGPFAIAATDTASSLQASVQDGSLTLTGTLPPHASATFSVLLPAQRAGLNALPDPACLRADTAAYWNAVLAPATQVQTPDSFLNDVLRSSQVRCLIAARNEADGARIAPWIAAISYGPLESEANSVIRGMDFLGHRDFAARGLDFFIHRYNTNGFLTTGYTTFGTAWHLCTLGEHYQLYRDTNWLRQVAPEVSRVANWIIRQTDKTKRPGRPEYGLMPPGVMADWNSFAYHYAMNAYYFAALREVGNALSDLPIEVGRTGPRAPSPTATLRTALSALTRAAELRKNILRAYQWTQAQAPALPLRNGTWIPHYPSQVHSPGKLADFFPGQDAGRSWCYDVELGAHQLIPTGVLDPRDREADRILDHMEDVQFLADGWFDYPAAMNEKDWFNLGGFSKVQPYYTRNCEIYALRDDIKPFLRSYFNALASLLNPEVLTFWEHFHHSGAWDKTHETGYFLHQTRTMLLTERGSDLWLAPLIPCDWLRDGQTLSVRNAPTRFGPVSYNIESHLAQGLIRATIEPPTRQAPDQIVLRFRHPNSHPVRSVRLNGKRHSDFDKTAGLVRLKPSSRLLTLEMQFR